MLQGASTHARTHAHWRTHARTHTHTRARVHACKHTLHARAAFGVTQAETEEYRTGVKNMASFLVVSGKLSFSPSHSPSLPPSPSLARARSRSRYSTHATLSRGMFFQPFVICEQQSCFASTLATLSFGADVASAEKTTAEWTTHVRRIFFFSFLSECVLISAFWRPRRIRDPCVCVCVCKNILKTQHIPFY